MSATISLSEAEQAVYEECMAKLKRSTTATSRVVIDQLGGVYRAKAVATLSSRGLPPGVAPREREIAAFEADSLLGALTMLRDVIR